MLRWIWLIVLVGSSRCIILWHLRYCGLYFDSERSSIASAVPLEIAGKPDCGTIVYWGKKGVDDAGRGAMLYKMANIVCCIPPMMHLFVSIHSIENISINITKQHRITSKIQKVKHHFLVYKRQNPGACIILVCKPHQRCIDNKYSGLAFK